ELFAGTPQGLWRREASGWRRVVGLADVEVLGLAVAGSTVYATTDRAGLWRIQAEEVTEVAVPEKAYRAGLLTIGARGSWLILGTSGRGGWQSRDGGTTWTRLPASAGAFITAIAIGSGRHAAFVAGDELWRTENGGATWHLLPNAPPARSLLAEGARLTAGTGEGEVWHTVDGGTTWQSVGRGLNPRLPVLHLARGDDGHLLAGLHDGFWQLASARWQRRTNGLGRVRIESVAQLGDGTLLAGHRDGLYRSEDGGRSWRLSDDPFPGRAVVALSADPGQASAAYAGTDGDGLFRTEDSGRTWEPLVSGTAVDEQIIPGIFTDPNDGSHLLARVAYERVYESTSAGADWTARWDGISTVVEMFTVAFDPFERGRLFAGAADGLLSRDPGRTAWQRVAPELSGQTVLAVLADPRVRGRVWIGATRGLFVSDDGGHRAGPTALYDVTVSAVATWRDMVFAGTKSHGLFAIGEAGATPVPEIGIRSVTALLPTQQGLLVASDDGLWRVRDWSVDRGVSAPPSTPASKAAAHDSAAQSPLLALDQSEAPNPQSPIFNRQSPLPAIHLLNPSDRLFRLAAEAGFRAVVVVFPWREIEPNPREFHWEQSDLWVAAARHYGLDLIVRLDQSPRWAAAPGAADTLNPVPARLDDFGHFAFRVASRYAGLVRGYVIWNEPNLAAEWGGQPPNPAEYVALLRSGAEAIRRADPQAPILGGALATTTRDDAVAMSDLRFLEGIYTAGGAEWFDILAAHPYGFGLPPDVPPEANGGMNVRRLAALREIMVRNDDGTTPIWVTEFGWSTSNSTIGRTVSPSEQVEYLVHGRKLIAHDFPTVDLVAIWNLSDGLPPE
ncbi:MAG TPA: hypothetical protein VER55_04785, partial [Ardenticatenaceae bacterium]|nr:hypothetical protein [Ardenticatenaceae bacterium]